MDDGRIDLQGLQIAYHQVDGGSPGLVFLHGWASSRRMWARELQALGGRHRCLAMDLPGHGQSSNPPAAWYTLDNFVGLTWAFTQALNVRPACLIGHSLGGTIAVDYALHHPEDVHALVLVNAVITGRLQPTVRWLYRPAPSRIIASLVRRSWPRLAARLQRALTANGLPLVPEGPVRRNLEDLTQATADSLLGSARAAATDVSHRLHEVRAPTLVIVGLHDRTVPPEEGRMAARRIPGAQLIELPADHHPGDQAPEAFLMALRQFLDRTSPIST